MTRDHHVRLPRIFVEDREARDLPTGRHRYIGSQAVIFAPYDLLVEMAQDADYQADGTDNPDKALKRSAARSHVLLRAVIDRIIRPLVNA